MGSSNWPLILYYVFFGVVGTLIALIFNKKRWWLGLIIGLVIALILITIFALLMGP